MTAIRFFFMWLGVLIAIVGLDVAFHGTLLKHDYEATRLMWRPLLDQQVYMKWILAAEVLSASVFSFMFLKGYENKGTDEGIRFGFLFGLIWASFYLVFYAVQPFPVQLVAKWIAGTIVQYMVVGYIAASIARPKNIG